MRTFVSAMVAVLAALAPAHPARGDGAVPVVVELFTSEGCSSCPPADGVLARLLGHPPEGVQVVALGEHVDYWDDLGWKDRFSAPAFTDRQQTYVRRFGLSGPYTPQLVVDGRVQLLGGDERAARAAIAAAAREPAAPAHVRVHRVGPGGVRLDLRAAWGGSAGDVLIAVVQEHARNRVAAGENAGRVLDHVAVVRWLTTVAHDVRAYRGTVTVPRAAAQGSNRVVLIVQDQGGGPVRAVATAELTPG